MSDDKQIHWEQFVDTRVHAIRKNARLYFDKMSGDQLSHCTLFTIVFFLVYQCLFLVYNSPAAELVDEPPHDWAHEHVDATEQAAHPGHGGPVTAEMLY